MIDRIRAIFYNRAMTIKTPMTIKTLFLLILLALCWGPSFLFIKVAVSEIPPLTLVTLRVAIAALILFVILKLQGKKLLKWIHLWKQFLLIAFTASSLPFFLISYGEMSISSSVAGIINGSIPIFTALFAHFFIRGELLSLRKGIGISLGFLGILFVFIPELLDSQFTIEFGMVLVLIASLSYATGMVSAKKVNLRAPDLIIPTWQLIFSTLLLLPFSLLIDRPWTLPMPGAAAIGSLFGLAILGTAIAFYLYYIVLREAGVVYLSTSTLLFPIIAIVLGVIFLHERPTWNSYLGAFLILSGLFITNALYKMGRKHVS